ncbi:membrane protein [Mycobacterium pseudoshottsii JCM 15466]|uniref:Uncharacterized protein n=3 Tax=Mycobacterium TaxID=1763 RepID=A0A9N7LSE1_9MYCO|nr:hypothetical protein [Mycobacterium ulcerans]MBC9862210.1 Integral membrane protein TerC [Mycobacterium pseudoshottsii]RFZ65559.1 hypothetical protein BB170200_01256 [Mycobacterium marinum]BBA87584.1 hypothetical protein MPSD_20050 [Mycobacterium pseudoshottsii JCM 15466]BBX59852.1 hypothetical protein MSHO_51970 [Mycobacterium shottsii]RFZ71061.1 hypothetical protein DL240490_00983 [Mycobacterium marinum]
MLEALHHNTIAFINRGRPVTTVEMSTAMSLTVIVVVLLLTTVASLVSVRGRRENAAARARRHALEYLDLHHPADPVEREGIFAALLQAEDEISSLPLKHRAQVQQDTELTTLLQQAHNAREARE